MLLVLVAIKNLPAQRLFIIRRIITSSFILLGVTVAAVSQPVRFTKTPAMGVHLAYFDFKGAGKLSSFGRSMKPGIAIHFQNSFSKQFDYSITLAGSFLEFPDGKGGSLGNGKQLLLENDFSVRARLVRSPALFNPYVQAGLGWSQYNSHYGMYSPVGLGLQVNVTPDIFLLVNTQYRIKLTAEQHPHFFHSIGIAGAITRKKIVQAKPVSLPPPVVKQAAHIDSDGDGIIDSLDACAQVPGVVRYQGCPAPDRDGDGILDSADQCADVKGVAAYKGCPMPDQDLDGIADAEDKCPGMAGSAVNGGCPEIETLKTMINWAAQHIFFETGSYRLLPRSFPSLDSVATVLKKIPVLLLTIEGHTDNVGGVPYNRTLSEKRAGAVMQYLINAGIAANRLQAAGYGQQNPVADNTTSSGRSVNRRVVLRLRY
ncbi:OmpA family protein [Niastella caeni]|uniref:OmpA family protein n=1 Tax=Niastella caeni TaxID=2569763 RepID=A0A4S8HCE4_9BACT|nr:OmpA family protein [Niastella caeni]THU32405.1 OmpA family protein [Niastella caeni]